MGAPGPRPRMTDPDVLFVVLDSLRRDRVSAYGHDRDTTPTLDRLAERATVYEHAVTPAPWTLPSHCSMFTGRFPSEHGVTNGFTDRSLRLPESYPTVAERLAERGYRTVGFSNNPWVGQLSDLNRGFDLFVEWDLEISQRDSAERHRRRDRVLSRLHTGLGLAASQPAVILKRRFFTANLVHRAQRWFTRSSSPAFSFMNLMEAHGPYYPPEWAFRAVERDPPGLLEARTLNTKLIPYMAGRTDLDPGTRERVMAFYEASARYQDAKLGALLDRLEAIDRFDDTLVVICADHGKTLGEYDRSATPSHYLRNVNTKVPLLVKRPGQTTGERVEAPVELTGLFDLLLDPSTEMNRPGVALTEDALPHTGRTASDVTRWWRLTDGRYSYLRCATGDEYLFHGEGVHEERERNEPVIREFREVMDERLAGLETTDRGAVQADEALGRSVESQLEDLGYL